MKDIMLLSPSSDISENNPIGYIFSAGENDIQFDRIGRLIMVESLPKVIQGINKILLTKRGTHPETDEYGTNLENYIGEKNTYQLRFSIIDEIINAIDFWNKQNADNPDLDSFVSEIIDINIIPQEQPNLIVVNLLLKLENNEFLGMGLSIWT